MKFANICNLLAWILSVFPKPRGDREINLLFPMMLRAIRVILKV
jgi:hypothetical protein